MNAREDYKQRVLKCINAVFDDKRNDESIEKAAELIADASVRGELIYIVGPGGHSNMIAEECMCRAGVLANIDPMIDVTNLFNGTVKSRLLQRNASYASGVLDQYYIPKGGVLIINNAYGINALTVELAIEAGQRGIHTIGISSPDHFNNTPKNQAGRHPSQKNINEVVEILLDNHMEHGDANVHIDKVDQNVGPVSTIAGVFTLQLLLIRAVEKIVGKGGTPDIWRSINLPGGDEDNVRLFKDYGNRVKYLL